MGNQNSFSVPLRLRKKEFPSWPTFRRWKNENEELRTLYVNSQQDKGIALENEIDDTMKLVKEGVIDASTANVLIQTLKWKMAKFYPKVFGDKVDVTSGDKPIQVAPPQIIFQAPKEEDE